MSDELSHLQLSTLKRIEELLANMGCQYAIVKPDGEVLGKLRVHTKAPKTEREFPHGEVRNYFRPMLENLRVGDVACIPFDKYKAIKLQSNICSWATQTWGGKTYETRIDYKNDCVEVMRTGGL